VDAFGEEWRILAAEALSYRATGQRVGVLPDEELSAQLVEFSQLAVRQSLALTP
jgi:hypothetical protein